MPTKNIQDVVAEKTAHIIKLSDEKTAGYEMKIENTLTQLVKEVRGGSYADGYKQGKFDVEVTAEYGEPEALQDNK